MKKGFTLLELLIVVGIMAMLGSISVNGYRAVVRGMEERSAISSASAFLRAARQRAQIDNKPICIIYWNEMLKAETDDEPAIIVGKAIAVQQVGRISGVENGNYFLDEFGDLNLGYDWVADGDTPDNRNQMRVYNLSNENCQFANVSTQVAETFCETSDDSFLKSENIDRGLSADNKDSKDGVRVFAFMKVGGNATFKSGDAYGFEFANLSLPNGYLFGSDTPSSMSQPTTPLKKLSYFKINSTDKGKFEIEVYSLRPEKGRLTAKSVGAAKDTY